MSRGVVGLVGVVVVIVLAAFVVQRLSTESLAIVVGLLIGTVAGLPMALVAAASSRGRREPERWQDPQPPTVIVLPSAPAQPQYPELPGVRRWEDMIQVDQIPAARYTIIGDD